METCAVLFCTDVHSQNKQNARSEQKILSARACVCIYVSVCVPALLHVPARLVSNTIYF